MLTPDSSRYWPADEWVPGQDVPSFDKQYVQGVAGHDRLGPQPAPTRPARRHRGGTRSRYVEAYERITGASFDDYLARGG